MTIRQLRILSSVLLVLFIASLLVAIVGTAASAAPGHPNPAWKRVCVPLNIDLPGPWRRHLPRQRCYLVHMPTGRP